MPPQRSAYLLAAPDAPADEVPLTRAVQSLDETDLGWAALSAPPRQDIDASDRDKVRGPEPGPPP